MVNRTRSVPMVFNHIRWANDILAARLEHGLVQDSITTLTGLSGTAISHYEQGKEENPKIAHFLLMCNVYDLDPREYFELER